MPTTEILTLPMVAGSDIGDPNNKAAAIMKEVGETLLKTSGVQQVYFGTQVESPDAMQLLVTWDKLESHQAFTQTAPYQPFLKRALSMAAGPMEVHHVDFSPDGTLSKVLSAPVTEVATFYYGPDASLGYADGVRQFRDKVDQSSTQGYLGAAAGATYEEIEREGVKGKGAVLVIGWQSVEAHMAFRETEAFTSHVDLLRKGAQKVEMHHVAFLNIVA